jgi:hypothetical protein
MAEQLEGSSRRKGENDPLFGCVGSQRGEP